MRTTSQPTLPAELALPHKHVVADRGIYQRIMNAYQSGFRAQKSFLESPNPFTYVSSMYGTMAYVYIEGYKESAPAKVNIKTRRINVPIFNYNMLERIAFAIGVQTVMEHREDITRHTH